MAELTPPTREDAERIIAGTGVLGTLEVSAVTPDGGRKIHWLQSLLDLVEFLTPSEEALKRGERTVMNYADPTRIVTWVRDVVGDPELADRMQAVVGSGKGYAVLAPQLRELALQRVIQCWELLKAGSGG